ncbi:MAG: glycosyltransferase family 4 protein [Colwellia sp.]|nr:glycosyltransferase family 4 protein [Colwellia sp.]
MKIFITGTRGIPNIPGGVERHCEQLYPRISSLGNEVLLSRRSSYVSSPLDQWGGVFLEDIYTPRVKSFEAIIHTALSIFRAWRWKADLVHIQAIGPALMVPLARMLGMRVVVTNHGPDYDRQKWGRVAKFILRLGEYLGCRYANEVIVISEHIRGIVKQRCNRGSHLIYNGVHIPELESNSDFIESLSLSPQGYLLAVARLVPEKGLHDLIDAFEQLDTNIKLVIAGDSDHEDAYSKKLKARVGLNPDIIMPGYIVGTDLGQVFTHARLFVMPSYHEGLPFALLEALSYGLPVVISDIPANMEVGLADKCYFKTGNVGSLVGTINTALDEGIDDIYGEQMRELIHDKYNWDNISQETISVYEQALK